MPWRLTLGAQMTAFGGPAQSLLSHPPFSSPRSLRVGGRRMRPCPRTNDVDSRRCTPEPEVRPSRRFDQSQVRHDLQIADRANSRNDPACTPDRANRRAGLAPVLQSVAVQVPSATSEPERDRCRWHRAVGLGRIAGVGHRGLAVPAAASEPARAPFQGPLPPAAEDRTGIHQNSVVAGGSIASDDQSLAVLRHDILAGDAGAVWVGHRINGPALADIRGRAAVGLRRTASQRQAPEPRHRRGCPSPRHQGRSCGPVLHRARPAAWPGIGRSSFRSRLPTRRAL
jgi:hypothetical protein